MMTIYGVNVDDGGDDDFDRDVYVHDDAADDDDDGDGADDDDDDDDDDCFLVMLVKGRC